MKFNKEMSLERASLTGRSFSLSKGGNILKKVITFTEEQVMQIQYMLNAVTVTGIQNAKQVAAIAQMLELGTPGEIKEPENLQKKEGEG